MVENSGISLQDLTTVHKIFTMTGQPGGSRRKRHYRKNRHKYQQEQFQQVMMPFDGSQQKDPSGNPLQVGQQSQQDGQLLYPSAAMQAQQSASQSQQAEEEQKHPEPQNIGDSLGSLGMSPL